MNPELDTIAIGPDVQNAHTTSECVLIDSIAKITKLIQELLSELKD